MHYLSDLNKYKCKFINTNDLMNALIMLSHKITMIISLQFSNYTFLILFDSAMKYLSVCNLFIFTWSKLIDTGL